MKIYLQPRQVRAKVIDKGIKHRTASARKTSLKNLPISFILLVIASSTASADPILNSNYSEIVPTPFPITRDDAKANAHLLSFAGLSGQLATVKDEVQQTNPVPEPSTWSLTLSCGGSPVLN